LFELCTAMLQFAAAAACIAAAAGAAAPGSLVATVWPAPSSFTGGTANRSLASAFSISYAGLAGSAAAGNATVPHTLARGFARYGPLVRPHRSAAAAGPGLLACLAVSVGSADEAPPQADTDESYTLTVPAAGDATLRAATVYGALRGLETFSQLVVFDFGRARYHVGRVPLVVTDSPRFAHRGFMVDTARHYQPLGMLKRLLDSMAFAKLNVLHWHAVDDQSFPLEVRSFPLLQAKGAYSAQERYTRLDVQDLVGLEMRARRCHPALLYGESAWVTTDGSGKLQHHSRLGRVRAATRGPGHARGGHPLAHRLLVPRLPGGLPTTAVQGWFHSHPAGPEPQPYFRSGAGVLPHHPPPPPHFTFLHQFLAN
jgi:hexosaminidase